MPLRPTSKIWINGGFVNWEEAKIHVLTHGLHYGYCIFEAMRCASTPKGPAVFRLPEHIDRFLNSAKIYEMRLGYSKRELEDACVELVRTNNVEDCYIRPVAFSGYGEMGVDPLTSKMSVAIACWDWGLYLGENSEEKGVRAKVSSWARIDSRSLPMQAKCAANYANSALAKIEAIKSGCDEAILLNSQGMVAEGGGENIFRVKDGILSTPPASSGILRGITRDSVIQFAQDEGIAFYRNDFTREELYTSDELFFSGTAAGIAKIREVDGREIGKGDRPVTSRL